jgi:hypothetical protein
MNSFATAINLKLRQIKVFPNHGVGISRKFDSRIVDIHFIAVAFKDQFCFLKLLKRLQAY